MRGLNALAMILLGWWLLRLPPHGRRVVVLVAGVAAVAVPVVSPLMGSAFEILWN